MGILNLDPNSFYKPSVSSSKKEALERIETMLIEGMDILDIGAFSSRPGTKIPSLEEEKTRLMPYIETISKNFPELIISVDTMRAEIAEEVFDYGVELINDISGGTFDPRLPQILSDHNKIYIAMHMRGLPENMMHNTNTHYLNLLQEIIQYFVEKLDKFKQLGLNNVILDPGFGFSKSLTDNFKLLHQMQCLKLLDKPLLIGLSRKSMIWKTLSGNESDALYGTLAAELISLFNGANILRVHDIKATRDIIKIYETIQNVNDLIENVKPIE